jgi:hypothetical protein
LSHSHPRSLFRSFIFQVILEHLLGATFKGLSPVPRLGFSLSFSPTMPLPSLSRLPSSASPSPCLGSVAGLLLSQQIDN